MRVADYWVDCGKDHVGSFFILGPVTRVVTILSSFLSFSAMLDRRKGGSEGVGVLMLQTAAEPGNKKTEEGSNSIVSVCCPTHFL